MFCLIRPPVVEAFRPGVGSVPLPIGLAYIAAAVEESGRSVHLIDAVVAAPHQKVRYIKGYLVGISLDEIVARIPDTVTSVGISVIFTHEWPAVVRLVDLIKAARPDITVILGGEHVTSMPEFCLAASKADMLVLGEGEETIVELLDALESGGEDALKSADGIAYRHKGVIRINRRRARQKDVDSIRPPAWHLFDVAAYTRHGFVGGMDVAAVTIPMLGTRGCPYQCSFCSSPNMWTPRWIGRDPIKVVDEIEGYMKTFGATNFPFQDLTAILKRDWVIDFCTEIIRRGLKITWQMPSGTRCEQIDAEVADLLRQSGMIGMGYAPESGSETIRAIIKKKMKTEALMSSIKAAVAAKLNVSVFTVLGFPQETEETLADNLPFLRRVREAGVEDVTVSFYMALPGTEIFNGLYDLGRIKMDQSYFGHIMHGSSFWPAVCFNDNLSRWKMVVWKFRMFSAFYGAKPSGRKGAGLLNSVWKALTGLFSDNLDSRLQTAFRHFVRTGWSSVVVRFNRPWISAEEERRLFDGWDDMYRDIRKQVTEQGIVVKATDNDKVFVSPNVIDSLRTLHDQPHELSVFSKAS